MKTVKKCLAIILLAAVAILVTACSVNVKYADVQVESIAVDGITKTEYVACDELIIADAVLIITYDDHTHESIPLTYDMLDKSSFDMNQPGTHEVRVAYEGKTTSFTIHISEWKLISVELASEPYVTEYIVGEDINPRGARIRCKFEGNKTKYFDVTTDMLEEYDKWTLGNAVVKLNYSGTQMSFTVNFVKKTPIKVQLNYLNESNNFVYVGKGDEYDVTGMKVRVFYDNDESPEYDVKTEIEEDVFISIDDSIEGAKDAVLMYYPSDYRDTYTYVFNGNEKVKVGDKVYPGQSLASNRLVRTVDNGTDYTTETVVLDEITSKSYGTVKSIVSNGDGTRTLTISTTAAYDLTEVMVKEGSIVHNNQLLGKKYDETVYTLGGGIVERIEDNVVYVKTAITTTFKSNVNLKSFSSMEILTYPTPLNFKDTTLSNMIEGDELNKKKGSVRVTYNDGSQEEFGMDNTAHISLVNDGSTSINDVFKLTPGRQKILVVYNGVIEYSSYFFVTMEKKYPVALRLTESTNKITGQTFYFGDRISISTMSYYVEYNNGETGEAEPLTEDMVGLGYTLECLASEDRKERESSIEFRLPERYEALIPEKANGDPGDYEKPVVHFWISPQPIVSIDFIQTPVKVYVAAKANLSYDGAMLNVYYRNNTMATLDFEGDTDYTSYLKTVDRWEDIETYNFEEEATTDGRRRVYVFTLDDDKAIITDIQAIVRKKNRGYEARVVYFDGYNVRSDNYASFRYYLIDSSYVVSSIKLATLKDSNGNEYYKEVYTQYEAWDLAGLQLNVSYQNGQTAMLSGDDLWSDMIYGSNTYKKGSNIPVKFTYLGATDDDSLKINVVDRMPTEIKLVRQGKTEYVGGYLTKMDFSDFVFDISYNSGPTERIDGTALYNIPNYEVSSGWWYEMYYVSERTTGIVVSKTSVLMQEGKAVYRLHFSYADENAEKGYSVISTPDPNDLAEDLFLNSGTTAKYYAINVWENENTIVAIAYEQNKLLPDGQVLNPTAEEKLNEETDIMALWGGVPVLSEVASGWELMLTEFVGGIVKDKMLTVTYRDSLGVETNEYVNITPEMLSYDVNDKTVGYRRVVVYYKNLTCVVMMYVWQAELSDVEVAITPLQNYIYTAINSEEDLDLTNGIIRLTFTKYTRKGTFAGYMTKYVNMTSKDITYSGFVKGEYSKEGKQVTINAVYKDYDAPELTASYIITVYDRQDVSFSYSNVIFFYGNAAAAAYTTKQTIDEFSLPNRIWLTYIETKNLLTIEQYLQLSDSVKLQYSPVTMYDEEKNYAMTMFIAESNIRTTNYIDPAAGKYYVKYGTVLMISEEDYEEAFGFPAYVPTYNEGSAVENFYACIDSESVQYVLGKIAWCKSLTEAQKSELTEEQLAEYDMYERLSRKLQRYVNVIVDKITDTEYAGLSAAQKAEYEEVSNEYFLMMRVVDNRPLARRYYETANYAFQNYTVIQKVIEVVVDTANATSKILRIGTKRNSTLNGNPFAIYYLTNPNYGILAGIKSAYEAAHPDVTYINSLYLASPNEDYFEIVVKFNDGYVETEVTKNVVAELFFLVMNALYSDDFREKMEMELSNINFDYSSNFTTSTYNFNKNASEEMKNKIKQKWVTGVNVFDKETVETAVAAGTIPYSVTYRLTFGDTKTRNGILQLLSGKLRIVQKYDDNELPDGYKLEAGTLGHSSYTLDLTKSTVQVGASTISIVTGE